MHSPAATEQRTMLADSVADFCRRSDPVKRLRVQRGSGAAVDRQAWTAMAELGWLGVLVPEHLGGLGLSISEYAIVARGCASSLVPEPLTAATMAITAIVESGNAALKADLLPTIVDGTVLPALAWQETIGDIDPATITLTATESADRTVRLVGRKRFVVGGAGADGFVVSAWDADGPALYWVPAASPNLSIETMPLADGRPVVELALASTPVASGNRLASGESALRALALALDHGNLAISAELLGLSTRALDITLDYLRTRTQFGKAIGAFQSLQHRAVDLYIHRRVGEATLEHALRMVGASDDPDIRSAAASRSKARAVETAKRITREAIQMHGAIGFTDDCDVGLYVKRALVLSAWLGNAGLHRRRYAALAPLEAG
jgi:alkylation response protein AidB-like acyl-CoA dehydrogenase